MNRLHVIGVKDCGKTHLVVDIVTELTLRGVRVGTIKHTSHMHVLDRPGTDSYRHRAAGAEPAAVVTPDATAVYRRTPRSDAYGALETIFGGCDLVLVEGDRHADGRKIEMWRADSGDPPQASDAPDIDALVTDRPSLASRLVPDRVAVVSRSNVRAIGDVVMLLAGVRTRDR